MALKKVIYEGLRGVLGNREHGQFQLGNRGTKAKYLREQGNKNVLGNTGTKHSLATFSLNLCCQQFFSFNLFAWNCGSGWTGVSVCVIKENYQEICGKREHSEIAVTTYYPGADLGVALSNPLNWYSNVSKRAVSDEKLRSNHCDNAMLWKSYCFIFWTWKEQK